ncbi:MAG TPA: EAL domain-containing protein [Phycisphaerales bacterium]|nr:EAL domain-containing protein [Phycisphaerales bacterium]
MSQQTPSRDRVLVIDDEQSVREAYRASLAPQGAAPASLDALDAALFGASASASTAPVFDVDLAAQGREGLERVKAAVSEGRPYGVAFVDMRMPPGWDGQETVEQLWKADPDLEVVICTAYSDDPWERVAERLGQSHRLLLLRKPFEVSEVWQLAASLSRKRRAESAMRMAHTALEAINAKLKAEIDARQTVEGRLKYDPLTALPNRLLLHERVERCIERARRENTFNYAVLFVDLDDFKAVNDTFGHAIGDALLIEVGKRLSQCLRGGDTAVKAEGDLPARLGGDEFVMLLDGVRNADEVRVVASRIQQALAQPVLIAGHEVAVAASIGFAMGSPHYQIPDDALRDADAALYQAKSDGKGAVRAFDDAIRANVLTRRRLANDLPLAVSGSQLRILYQPIHSLETGALESFEALLRWQHPELGPISPLQFIPVAEESGAIHEIGLWVLREACQQLRVWHERFPQSSHLSVAVNVSYHQLASARFAESVRTILKQVGLDGRHLNIEITEGVFIDSMETALAHLSELRAAGIGLHLDDFGTGYSSLSLFHQLPIDAIKIDRSFVANMGLDGRVANIVQAIQVMASNRNLKVIAEGIETIEQLAQLQALGCASGQGYFMSRPVDAAAAQELIRKGSVQGSGEGGAAAA